jgi:DNA polymerase III alpha subunit
MDHEQSTQLKGRVLWYDGTSTVCSMEYLYDRILDRESLAGLFVDIDTPEIKKYNTLGKPEHPLTIKQSMDELSHEWNIPDLYKTLDVTEYLAESLENEFENNLLSKEEQTERLKRTCTELTMWEGRKMTDLLRTLIHMVDEFKKNNIVWGTGRGSSCSSYLLYLIGIHDVDSVSYNLDIGEFFRD